ncbi:M20 family metallopeptidase [Flammeovirgaceae bacterium SG7u.111]|nr:M20 family metallopeptidase [Flammeovirgaceae bacterium SG7u.132]WPO35212.1 M20 family metallopeptidase [Flammeovirgaceae bacterium SG7u.111]
MELSNRIKQVVSENIGEIIANRRHIHSHPELSFEEVETAKFIAEKLRSYGLEPQEGVAGTGVVALVKGKNPDKKTVALRADIDALPIKEANDISYKSKKEGVMHACGHDVHSSSLLGVAKVLSEVKDDFEGTVKLIFQPGEEKAPGGASMMIKEGVLENPAPKRILGQHVMPLIPVGKVGFREGIYMASADEIYLTVKGKGGHAAMPDKLIDPVLTTAYIIVALQQVVSRNADPKIPSVLSFGRIIADGATNVIPNTVEVAGTFRTLDEEWRAEAKKRIKKIAGSIAESMGAEVDVNIVHGYPFLSNHPEFSHKMRKAAEEYMGEENVVDLDIWMAAEDFSFYSQEIDACFYRLGTRNEEKGIVSGVHTPTFNIDEDALEVGAGLMAWLAISELHSED